MRSVAAVEPALAVAAVELARLRSAAKQSWVRLMWSAWHIASSGFTTASQPNAASQARQLLPSVRPVRMGTNQNRAQRRSHSRDWCVARLCCPSQPC